MIGINAVTVESSIAGHTDVHICSCIFELENEKMQKKRKLM